MKTLTIGTTLYMVQRESPDAFWVVPFFGAYTPSGNKHYPVSVIPKPCTAEPTDYKPTVGDRVRYVGSNAFLRRWLKGKSLVVEAIHQKDVGCITEGENHLRFFYPWELEGRVKSHQKPKEAKQ